MAAVLAPILISAGMTATTAAVVSTVAVLAATTAVSYFLQMALMPEEKDPGIKAEVAFGEAVPQSFIVGRYATAGSLIYSNTWGNSGKTPNGYLVQVFCLSDLPCDALSTTIWVNNKKCTIDTGTSVTQGNPVTDFSSGGADYMWVKFLDGSQTTVNSYLSAKFGSDATRPWGANMIGRGRAIAIVTTRYNAELFSGLPTFVFGVDGIKLYDPRLDSTNGGTGTHVYGTSSTYAFTRNPKVIDYNIARGVYHGSEWFFGGQAWPAYRFDNSSWFAAMNECDTNVTLNTGGTENQFRIGAEIRINESPADVMDRINISSAGRTAECGGIYKTFVGAVGASIYSFTDDDIVVTEDNSADYFPGHENWINTVRASFINPADMWQPKSIKAKTNASFVTADGGQILEQQLGLTYVTSNTQTQRLARMMLHESRRHRTHVVALPPDARKVEPLDVVSWTSTKFGYTAKKFIVGELTRTRYGVIIAPLREVDPTDNAWTAATDEDVYTDGVYGDINPASQTISITATAVSTTNNAGVAKKPAIKIAWAIDADDVDIRAVRYQVRDATTLAVVARGRTDDWDDGEVIISHPSILRNQNYEVRARYIPISDRLTAWCAWAAATVPDVGETVVLGAGDVDTVHIATDAIISKASFSGNKEFKTPSTLPNGTKSFWPSDNPSAQVGNPNPSPVFVEFNHTVRTVIANSTPDQDGSVTATLKITRNGKLVGQAITAAAKLARKTSKTVTKKGTVFFYDFTPPSGSSTYKLEGTVTYKQSRAGTDSREARVDGTVKMVWWKR